MVGHSRKQSGTATSPLDESLDSMASIILADSHLDGILQYLVSLAEAGVPGVDGASVTLAASDRLETRHATSDDVTESDRAQYESGKGPCLEAKSTAQTVNIRIADSRERWPAFAESSLAAGFTDVMSIPLGSGDSAFGSLNLYSRGNRGFDEKGGKDAQLFARQASVVVANAAALAAAGVQHAQLEEAITTRDVIGVAKGILMVRESCTADEAFDVLRRASQRANRKLREIAQDLVDATTAGSVTTKD